MFDVRTINEWPPARLCRVASTGTITRRVAGMRVRDGFVVTELEPDTRLGMRLSGEGYALTEPTTLEATPDGTRATIVDVLEPTSLGGRLLVAVSGPFIRRDLKARSEPDSPSSR